MMSVPIRSQSGDKSAFRIHACKSPAIAVPRETTGFGARQIQKVATSNQDLGTKEIVARRQKNRIREGNVDFKFHTSRLSFACVILKGFLLMPFTTVFLTKKLGSNRVVANKRGPWAASRVAEAISTSGGEFALLGTFPEGATESNEKRDASRLRRQQYSPRAVPGRAQL